MPAVNSAMNSKFRVMGQVSNTTPMPPPAKIHSFSFSPSHPAVSRSLKKEAKKPRHRVRASSLRELFSELRFSIWFIEVAEAQGSRTPW